MCVRWNRQVSTLSESEGATIFLLMELTRLEERPYPFMPDR